VEEALKELGNGAANAVGGVNGISQTRRAIMSGNAPLPPSVSSGTTAPSGTKRLKTKPGGEVPSGSGEEGWFWGLFK